MNFSGDLIQTILSGVAVGCIYGLVALGFVLIYKATEVINFAQGDMMVIGAFIAYSLITFLGWSYWSALLVTTICLGVFGTILERIVLRPLIGEPVFAIVMLTLGLGYFIRAFVSMVPGWGTDTYGFLTPFSDATLNYGELVLAQEQVAIILMTVAFILILFLFFRYTRVGVAMRATSQNQLAAVYMGISINKVFSLTWTISGSGRCGGHSACPDHFRAHEHGLHRSQGLSRRCVGGVRQRARGHRRRGHHRRVGESGRGVSAHWMEGRGRLDHTHSGFDLPTTGAVRHSRKEEGVSSCAL